MVEVVEVEGEVGAEGEVASKETSPKNLIRVGLGAIKLTGFMSETRVKAVIKEEVDREGEVVGIKEEVEGSKVLAGLVEEITGVLMEEEGKVLTEVVDMEVDVVRVEEVIVEVDIVDMEEVVIVEEDMEAVGEAIIEEGDEGAIEN